MSHNILKWIKRQIINLCGLLVFPVLALLIYYADQNYLVVNDFKITSQYMSPEGVLIEGTMNKVRNCRILEVVSKVDDITMPVVFMDPGTPPMYKRPTGVHKWGPWLVTAERKDGVKLYAFHRCHIGWEQTTLLGTFVVGIQ